MAEKLYFSYVLVTEGGRIWRGVNRKLNAFSLERKLEIVGELGLRKMPTSAIWQSWFNPPDIWHGSAQMKQKCVLEFFHAEKKASIDIHQYLLPVNGESNSGCWQGEVVGGVFQQHQKQGTSTGARLWKGHAGSHCCQKCTANGGSFIEKIVSKLRICYI